jgi:hypothetical protein
VFNFSIKFIILLCNNTNSLLIVTLDCRCTIKLKINTSVRICVLVRLSRPKYIVLTDRYFFLVAISLLLSRNILLLYLNIHLVLPISNN